MKNDVFGDIHIQSYIMVQTGFFFFIDITSFINIILFMASKKEKKDQESICMKNALKSFRDFKQIKNWFDVSVC